MKIADLVGRALPSPFEAGGKIPWDDPGFSERMLKEHLSQRHDRASRRSERIDAHVRALHEEVLEGRAGRVLDLACGPGLYASRLAALGHRCVGIDFSPASIDHARAEADSRSLACVYRHEDLHSADLSIDGADFDLAMILFGELDTFEDDAAVAILAKARAALAPGACMVAEVHTESHVRGIGSRPPTFYAAQTGPFSERPHVCLIESVWHEAERAAVERFSVIEDDDGPRIYASTTRARTPMDYEQLFVQAGFDAPERSDRFGNAAPPEDGLVVLVARVAE
jgi:SAM-dependent methyltransferase